MVCHRTPDKIDLNPEMYPRHLGIVLKTQGELLDIYENILIKITRGDLPKDAIFQGLFLRNKDQFEQHTTFFLKDPSNNLIEFKWYLNPDAIFN